MWWGIVTIATVGYGDMAPITPAGKLGAGIVMLIGIALFAVPAGILANGFAVELKKRDFLVRGLRAAGYECEEPGGAFYLFPRVPKNFKNGQAFIDGFIMKHNVERAMSPLHGHRGFTGYQFAATLLLLLPWTPALIGAFAGMRSDFADPLKRFLWLWFLFVLMFFTVVSTKLPHYVLYGATPLFLLVALKAVQWARGPVWQRLLLVVPPLLLIALLPLVPMLVAAQAAGMRRPHARVMLERAAEVAAIQQYVQFGVAFAVAAGVVAVLLWRRTLLAAGALALLLGVALMTMVSPYVGELLQGPTRRAAAIAAAQDAPAVLWHFPAPTFSAYLGRPTPSRAPQPGELAFTRLGQVPPEWRVEVLLSEGGVELVRVLP
jgi:4-amino-4-deoxy-L-arabinose transferase-like glycosyltransferase